MNFNLSEEQKLLQAEARKLSVEVFKDRAARWDANSEVPWDNIRTLAGQGYFGLLIPEAYGGTGASIMDLVLVLEQFAWSCCSTALYVFSSNVHANRIAQLGDERQRARYLPGIATGKILPSHGMSEPQAGSDARRISTSATLSNGSYIVNGGKCWISRGAVAHLFLVDVVFRDGDEREHGMLLIERDTPGFKTGKVEPLMGHRGSPSTELIFSDCRVPAENRMAGGNMQASLTSMSLSRCANAAMALGAAQRAHDEAVDYVKQRAAFGKHLADFQGLRWIIADMQIKLEASRLLIYRAATNATAGFPSAVEAALAKAYVNEAALSVASDAMQLFGANGLSTSFPLERIYRDIRAFGIAGGTTQIQKNLIARTALGRRKY